MVEYKRKSRISYRILFLFSLIISIYFTACNDEPTQVGYSFITDTVGVYSLSSSDINFIEKVTSEPYHLPVFQSGVVAIGKFQEYEAISNIRFAEFSDTLD